MDLRSSRILSVCTGVGKLDTGVRVALPSARVVCCVEHEAYAAHILASRMEDEAMDEAPIWADLRTFDGRPWRGLVDGIVGGYPCQPFSQAGKRLGAADPRHLWPEILRLFGEVQPRWGFFENVRGHLKKGFDIVYRDLRAAGYRVKPGLFSAEEVGASHQRERVFILAMANAGDGCLPLSGRRPEGRDGVGPGSSELVDPDGLWGGEGPCDVQAGWDAAQATGSELANGHGQGLRCLGEPVQPSLQSGDISDGSGGGEVADSESAGLQGSGSKVAPRRSQPAALRGDGKEGSLPIFAPGPGDLRIWGRVVSDGSLNGLAPSTQPGVRMLADGVALVVDESRRDQLRAIGNGVVPLQAAFALSVLARQMGVVLS